MTSSFTFSRRAACASILSALTLLPMGSFAQDKAPIKILVGYAAGGGTDILARMLAEELGTSLGRTFIVENKPGAGGRIAIEAMKNAPATENIIMVAPNGLTSIQSIVYKNVLRYDPTKDLVPVAKLAVSELAVAVTGGLKINNAKDLAVWLKANPNKASFGSPAAGGLPHFAGLMITRALGADGVHVAYKGGAPVALAVTGGEIPMGVSTIDDFAPLAKDGRLKIVGTLGTKRSALSPNIPTFIEQGINVTSPSWSALWTCPGMPEALIQEISAATQKALASPKVQAKLTTLVMAADYSTPSDLGKLMQAELAMWRPVIESSGFKPE